jgi:hypothetical protein
MVAVNAAGGVFGIRFASAAWDRAVPIYLHARNWHRIECGETRE